MTISLKAELVQRELTQRKVAADMGITHGYLSKLVTGSVPWSRTLALAFSAVTGIPMIEVLPEHEEVTA